MVLAFAAGVLGVAATAAMARRERRATLAHRTTIFDGCLAAFEETRKTIGRDGFPKIEGRIDGRSVTLKAIPDSLTTKRLPQLWVCVTLKAQLPIESDVAVLVRPTGAEFFALTHRLRARPSVPPSWPGEAMLRGSRLGAQGLVEVIEAPVAALLADPKVKEVAVTRRGLRIVYQMDQGKRGEYLLLRQCVFADSELPPATLASLLEHLMAIEEVLVPAPIRDGVEAAAFA